MGSGSPEEIIRKEVEVTLVLCCSACLCSQSWVGLGNLTNVYATSKLENVCNCKDGFVSWESQCHRWCLGETQVIVGESQAGLAIMSSSCSAWTPPTDNIHLTFINDFISKLKFASYSLKLAWSHQGWLRWRQKSALSTFPPFCHKTIEIWKLEYFCFLVFFCQLQLLASRQVNSLNCKFKSLAEEYLSGEYLSEEYLSGTSSLVQRCRRKGC